MTAIHALAHAHAPSPVKAFPFDVNEISRLTKNWWLLSHLPERQSQWMCETNDEVYN